MKKKVAAFCSIALIVFFILFLLGPTVEINTQLKPMSLPDDLDHYLKQSEAHFPDIVPGAEKTILWANATKTRTPPAVSG